MIEVTESAATKVRSLLEADEKVESHGLRMKVVGGGCSGLQYQLSFDDAVAEDDTVGERGGIGIAVDAMSLQYLSGAEIDYEDDLQGARFVIRNPNATTTCGCGSSFSV